MEQASGYFDKVVAIIWFYSITTKHIPGSSTNPAWQLLMHFKKIFLYRLCSFTWHKHSLNDCFDEQKDNQHALP